MVYEGLVVLEEQHSQSQKYVHHYTKYRLHHTPFEILSSTIDIHTAGSAAKTPSAEWTSHPECNVKHKSTAGQNIVETCSFLPANALY